MALLTNNSVSDFGIPLPENIFVKENNKYVPTEDGIKFLQQYIKSGGTYSALSREINISATTIAFNCKKLGLQNERSKKIKGTKKKYPFNEHFFHIIDSPHKAYWYGFIAADGYVDNLRNYLEIGLAGKDKQTLINFSKDVNSKKPIYERMKQSTVGDDKRFSACSVRLYSAEMIKDLESLGLCQNKSLTYIPPTLEQCPRELIKYWILGYFDGDGCISICQNGRFLSSFVGTKETLQYIENYFGYTNISISREHAKRSETEIYSIKFSEGKTLEMLNHLYDDNITDICMKRKYDKYLSLISDN